MRQTRPSKEDLAIPAPAHIAMDQTSWLDLSLSPDGEVIPIPPSPPPSKFNPLSSLAHLPPPSKPLHTLLATTFPTEGIQTTR